jgi:hypothetical protein
MGFLADAVCKFSVTVGKDVALCRESKLGCREGGKGGPGDEDGRALGKGAVFLKGRQRLPQSSGVGQGSVRVGAREAQSAGRQTRWASPGGKANT